MKQNPAVKTGYLQNPGSVEAKSRPGKIKTQSAIGIEKEIFKDQSGMKSTNTLSNEQSGKKVRSCYAPNYSVCQKTLVAAMRNFNILFDISKPNWKASRATGVEPTVAARNR